MNTGYRAYAIVQTGKTKVPHVIEVIPELSIATREAETLRLKNKQFKYDVHETEVRFARSEPFLQKEARRLILEEWNKRPSEQRTEQCMFTFYSEIRSSMPELLFFRTKSDPWQLVHCWLTVGV